MATLKCIVGILRTIPGTDLSMSQCFEDLAFSSHMVDVPKLQCPSAEIRVVKGRPESVFLSGNSEVPPGGQNVNYTGLTKLQVGETELTWNTTNETDVGGGLRKTNGSPRIVQDECSILGCMNCKQKHLGEEQPSKHSLDCEIDAEQYKTMRETSKCKCNRQNLETP